MAKRRFDLRQQVLLSRRIRKENPQLWQEFLLLWTAFNALYNIADAGSEIEKIESLLASLSDTSAEALVIELKAQFAELPNPPPGDMRYTEDDPRFRQRSINYTNTAYNPKSSSHQRLAALMTLVYQIRCNITHGAKDPDIPHDNQLIGWGLDVLKKTVPAVEQGFMD